VKPAAAQWQALVESKTDVGDRVVVELRAEELAVAGVPFALVAGDVGIDGVWGDPGFGLAEPVGAVAAPAVVRRVIDHARPYRVEFDIAHGGQQVGVGLYQRGFVAAVPEGAGALLGAVEVLDVASTEGDEELGDGFGSLWRQEQVHVVGHQYVGVKLAAGLPERLVQPAKVGEVVLFVKEAGVAIVPALHNVQGQSIEMGAGAARLGNKKAPTAQQADGAF